MQDVHRLNDQTDVAGVLALGVCGFLMGDQTQFADRGFPALEVVVRPIAIDAAQGRLANRCDLPHDGAGMFGRDIVSVDQHGQQGAVTFGHGSSFLIGTP